MRGKEFFKEFFKEYFRTFFKYDLKSIFAILIFSFAYISIDGLYAKGGFPLEFDYFTYFLDHIICHIKNLEHRKMYQHFFVEDFLRIIKWNEFCFYINPNSIEFQQTRILYQLELKIFLEKLNLDVFDDPNEALRFITAFYDHYLKIIELNNEVIKNININKQCYHYYNTFFVILYRIIFFILSIKLASYLLVYFEKR